jgi:2-methylcitrate dehydratase PrpD
MTDVTVAETLAEFVASTRFQDLPDRTIELAAMIVASTLASAACGRNIISARIIRDVEVERGGRPDASVWFEQGVTLPVAGAARANALMSDAARALIAYLTAAAAAPIIRQSGMEPA